MNVNQLLEYAIPLSPLHHKQSGWRYLGNEESCRRSAGVKKTGFSGAFHIPECEEFSMGGQGGHEEAGEGEVAEVGDGEGEEGEKGPHCSALCPSPPPILSYLILNLSCF